MKRKRLLIIVAISSIFWLPALIAGLAYWKSRDRIRWRVTSRRTFTVARAIDAYHDRTHAYPVAREMPVARLAGLGIDPRDTRDGWARNILYMSSGRHYLLWSLGADGKPQHMEGGGEYKGYDVDFVIYDGALWQVPAGHF